jgi:hypothetical protein
MDLKVAGVDIIRSAKVLYYWKLLSGLEGMKVLPIKISQAK